MLTVIKGFAVLIANQRVLFFCELVSCIPRSCSWVYGPVQNTESQNNRPSSDGFLSSCELLYGVLIGSSTGY